LRLVSEAADTGDDVVNKARPMQAFVDQINEANQAHAVNYATLMIALMEKGIVSASELDAARAKATSLVDQEWAKRRDEIAPETLEDLWKLLGIVKT
jgi:hypothetical protein